MIKRLTTAGLAILLLWPFLQGCSTDRSPVGATEPVAPALPSQATMSMDLTLFESADVSGLALALEAGTLPAGALEEAAAPASHLNFLNAAVRVLYLQIVVLANMAEPVASFALAAYSIPQPQEDGWWLWTYIFVRGGDERRVYLYGKNEGDYSSWRMEVSGTVDGAPLERFVWFEGQVLKDDAGGYWQFYEPVEPPAAFAGATAAAAGVPTIRIDWTRPGDDEAILVFLVNKPGDPAEGSSLTSYGSAEECSIEFYNAETDKTGTILWRPDGCGYIEWPDYRGGERSCWDERQRNIECPI